MKPSSPSSRLDRAAFATAVACGGCAGAVLMWWMWFFCHLPGLGVPRPVAAGAILVGLLGGLFLVLRLVPRADSLKVGLSAGLLAALLNLTILGGYLTNPPADPSASLVPEVGAGEVRPNAALIVLGFLSVGAGAGLAAAALARLASRPAASSAQAWLARMGIVGCAATLPLLVLGGMVTSTESGMAVPDAPTTYGSNMFLYPIELMAHPRIFLEHTHRLFGSLVGLTTFCLAALVFVIDARHWAKRTAALLFVLVVIQGFLGMLRVDRNNLALAIAHGVVAQGFLALMVAQACWLTPAWTTLGATDRLVRTKKLATGLTHAIFLQLVLGAAFRHLDGVSKGAMHALWSHVGFAFVVVALAALTGASAGTTPASDPRHSILRRAGLGAVIVVGLQVALGFAALMAVLLSPARGASPTSEELRAAAVREVPAYEAVLTTAHQANGAILLALAAVIAAWARRRGPRPAQAPAPGATVAPAQGA